MRCKFLGQALAASVLICVICVAAHAGVNRWTTKGPPGGWLYVDFDGSTTDPDVFYVAYTRSFHRSTDGGATWEAYDFIGQVADISVDPADGRRIYVAVLHQGLFRSTDGGVSFTQIAPNRPNMWSAGAGPNNVVYYASHDGIRRSNDGGDTFGAPTPCPQSMSQLFVDADNPDSIYGLHGPYVARSTDAGVTWSETQVDPSSSWVYSFVKLPSGVLVVATGGGLYTSSDDGATWVLRVSGHHWSVASDPATPNTVIAASGRLSASLVRSTDGGTTWAPFGQPPRGIVHRALIGGDSADRLVLANGQGVQLSSDGGVTWSDALRGPIASGPNMASALAANSRIYAYTGDDGGGLFHTSLDGDWERVGVSLVRLFLGQARLAVRPGAPERVYLAAFGRGVFRSDDGGQHWVHPGSELSDFGAAALAFDPLNPDVMYATASRIGATESAFFRSEDAGSTWTAHSVDLPGVQTSRMAVDPANGSRILLASGQGYSTESIGGLYLSVNGGVNWTRIAFAGQDVTDVAVDPSDSHRIYAATASGLHVSVDAGATFSPNDQYAIITDQPARVLAIDPVVPSTIYVGSLDYGRCCELPRSSFVLRSVDRGQSWEVLRASSQSPSWSVGELLLDPNRPSLIYVNTSMRGVATYEIVNDLAVSISGHSGERPVGAPSTLRVRAEHLGALAATAVRIITELPPGLVNVTAATDLGACAVASETLTCDVPVLRPAQVANIDVTYTPPSATLLAFNSTIVAHEADGVAANNSAQASALAGEVVDLAVTITPSAGRVNPGSAVTYDVQIRNDGPSAASAATLTFTAASGLSLASPPEGCAASAANVVCSLGAMAIGEVRSFSFAATTSSAGSFVVRASIAPAATATDLDSVNNEAEVATTVAAPQSSGGGGGGGATGLTTLLTGLWLIRARRRSRCRR